jgi:transcriptional regulator with XRE-family HTH domain
MGSTAGDARHGWTEDAMARRSEPLARGATGSAAAGDRASDQVPATTAIGAQLKAARLARRKTLAQVALESGLTKGFVSKLERDQATASVASLMRLCQALGISVGTLFNASSGEVVRSGAYPAINFGGSGMSEYLLTPHGERRLEAILSDIEPGGGSGEELYGLPADVEFVLVLAGRLEVTFRDHVVMLDTGDAFTFPPRTSHCFRGTADTTTRVLWVFAPALPPEHTAATTEETS